MNLNEWDISAIRISLRFHKERLALELKAATEKGESTRIAEITAHISQINLTLEKLET